MESYYPTIENTFSKVIKYKGQEYATEIIDTAGQVSSSSQIIRISFFRDHVLAVSDVGFAFWMRLMSANVG